MDKLLIILIAAVFGLIGINLWNNITLRQILKRPLRQDKLNDEKYFELKSKQEFQITLFTVLIAIAGFIGYNSLDNLKDTVKKNIDEKLDSANERMSQVSNSADSLSDALTGKIDTINTTINGYSSDLQKLETKQANIDKQYKYSELEFNNLVNRVKEINSKNLLKLNYYIVDSLTYDLSVNERAKSESDIFKTYYFKDLRTSIGDMLPEFNTPPFIITTANEAYTINIKDVTTEYFRAVIYMPFGEPKTPIVYFKIFVSELSK